MRTRLRVLLILALGLGAGWYYYSGRASLRLPLGLGPRTGEQAEGVPGGPAKGGEEEAEEVGDASEAPSADLDHPLVHALTGDAPALAAFQLRSHLVENPGSEVRAPMVRSLDGVVRRSTAEAERLLELGATWEARNELSVAYFAATDGAVRAKLRERLDGLNAELVFSPRPSKDALMVTVKKGDTLSGIGGAHNVPYRFIMETNGISGTTVRVGDRLKVVDGVREIWVSKSDFTLNVLLSGHYMASFPIGLGKFGRTPTTEFQIAEKIVEPTWYGRDGVYPYGHAKNPLGTHWLGFNDTEDLNGFGIHGTRDASSIGQESSDGCIRLRNEHVERLFHMVPRGTKVIIKP